MFNWYNEYVSTDWVGNEYVTYLKLKPGTESASLATQIGDLVKSHYPTDREFKSEFTLQSFGDIHLYSDNIQGNELNANSIKPFYLYMFGAVGFLLLLIACLNYMNLSTAAALKRTGEIGTASTRVPGEWKEFPNCYREKCCGVKWKGNDFVGIDKDFLKTYNIKLLEGRTIDDPKSDSLKIVHMTNASV